MLNEAGAKVHSKSAIEAMDLGDEEDFASMFEASIKEEKGGSLVEGVIVSIKDDEDGVLIDVGKKQEGFLWKSEILDENGELKFKVGDKITVMITGFRNERPGLSYKKAIRGKKVEEFIANYSEENEVLVDGVITGKNKGGYIIEENDIEFFLPKSQAYFKDSNTIIGKKVKAKVIKVDPKTKSIVISRKVLVEADREKRTEIITALLAKDDVTIGVIKKITSYGMFVDVGGVDGLVHYSEISYKGPVNPSSIYKEGEEVEVKAIKYDEEKRHLSLSIKAAMEDPWDDLAEQLEVGDAVKVLVSNIEPYGAFVDLGNDVEGFLHVSEISWDKNIKHPKDYLEVDQEIDVEIVEMDFEKKKLRVSLKQILPKPFEGFIKEHKTGNVVTGKITTITNFGAFVRIGSIEGLLHNEDASWDRSQKCRDLFKEGDEVEVKIVRIDYEKEKISLSKKDLEESPIDVFAKTHKNGDIVMAKIRDKKEFGIFVELEDGVDALIRHEDLGEKKSDDLEIGEEIEAAISFIDTDKNRIRLSVKRVARAKEKAQMDEYNNDERSTLGDVLKDQLNK
ncbi:MAG TPA: 30S ribosomal protein S1 [Campylobacterales bacterium]|nr:30S ribosomal protein S1 [Campylobacterales bacterium]HIP60751.1 30S ribosomal protein S1 [Campylobacterales bacterium]